MMRTAWVLAVLVVAISAYPNVPTETPATSDDDTVKDWKINKQYYTDFHDCVKQVVDFEQLGKEIETAKLTANGISLFVKNFCDKSTQLKTCFHTYIDKVGSSGLSFHKTFFTNALLDQDIDYICYNDGERITSFFTANGLECVQEKTSAFEDCGDQAFLTFTPEEKTAFDKDTLSQEKVCSFTDTWFGCLATAYKGCEPATPATILEELFSFARKNSVCNTALPKN